MDQMTLHFQVFKIRFKMLFDKNGKRDMFNNLKVLSIVRKGTIFFFETSIKSV